MAQYLQFKDCIEANGDRHLQRTFNYYLNGYPNHYWEGSLKKALRNYKKADELQIFKCIDDSYIIDMLDIIANNMANQILYGK